MTMAAPVVRCACGAPLAGYSLSTESCDDCDTPEAESLLDDPDAVDCERCECPTGVDDLDEDGVCSDCRDGDEERRQSISDYRHSVL